MEKHEEQVLWLSWESGPSCTGDPRFESSHRQILFTIDCIEVALKMTKIKKKEASNGPNFCLIAKISTPILFH